MAGASEDADISSPNTRQRRSSADGRNGSYDVMADHGPSPGNISTDTTAGDMDESGQERPQSTPNLGNSIMRTVVSSGNDALNILFEAAAAHSRGNGMGADAQPGNNASSGSRAARNGNSWTCGDSAAPSHVATRTVYPVEISQAPKEVLEVWEACRFVKMGWFTSKEAVTLIDLFVHPNPGNGSNALTALGFSRTCLLYPQSLQISMPTMQIHTGFSREIQSSVLPS